MRAVEGHISIGLLVAFQALVTRFTAPITRLNGVAGRIQDFAADVARLKDVENFPVDPLYSRREPAASTRRLQGPCDAGEHHLRLQPARQAAADRLLADGRPGPAGRARRRLGQRQVHRLPADLGPLQPVGGRRSASTDSGWRTSPRSALAASVSFVDQDVFLFEGTVRDNVALWDPSIPDEAVVTALRDAAVCDDVIAAPARRHPQPGRAGRPQLLRRAAPAPGDRPGAGAAAQHPRARRGDQRPGRGDRAGHHRQPAARAAAPAS